MIKILNNLVPKNRQKEIKKTLDSDTFPWYYYDTILSDKEINKPGNKHITLTPAYVHTLFILPNGINSDAYAFFVDSILSDLNIPITEVLRIRIRRTMQHSNHDLEKYNYPHVDLKDETNYKSLIYYVEDSDGDTFFFDKTYQKGDPTFLDKGYKTLKRVSPKQGKAIYFDGNIYHSGNNPVKYDKRTVINFDFKIQEENK